MKNTARTTVREGRQSSDNTYVRIAAAEQNCLQALSEHRRLLGRGFDSYRGSCIATLGKLFTPMCLCHQAV